MARTPRNYAHNKQLSTTPSNIVDAVSGGVQSQVSKCSFYNTNTTTNRLVTLYVVENGGAADTGTLLKTKSIGPEQSWNCIEILTEVLTNGMTVQASQDAGTDVNANCSGSDFS